MNSLKISPSQSRGTLMYQEAMQSSSVVQKQIDKNSEKFIEIGKHLRESSPKMAVTIGRGSSDHAAVYARYLIETQLGVITSPSGLSVSSLYNTKLNAQGSLSLAFSQSGKSPDIVSAVKAMSNNGSYTISLVNVEDSPLANETDFILPLHAGPELSVAATKSFITSMTAALQLVAHWKNDIELIAAINDLPSLLAQAAELDWRAALPTFQSATNAFVLGRGLGYGLARESALKFKETCSLHAESYSSAEVLHGPAAIVKNGFPILAFTQNDQTKSSMHKTLSALSANGGNVFVAGLTDSAFTTLPTLNAHSLLQPILMAQSFYLFVNELALSLGYNPDTPQNLSKVTETI